MMGIYVDSDWHGCTGILMRMVLMRMVCPYGAQATVYIEISNTEYSPPFSLATPEWLFWHLVGA
jgi:hypothetical protein